MSCKATMWLFSLSLAPAFRNNMSRCDCSEPHFTLATPARRCRSETFAAAVALDAAHHQVAHLRWGIAGHLGRGPSSGTARKHPSSRLLGGFRVLLVSNTLAAVSSSERTVSLNETEALRQSLTCPACAPRSGDVACLSLLTHHSHQYPASGAQAPFAAVALFGLYSIAAVLYGVFTFHDCPEEAASLRMVTLVVHGSHRCLFVLRLGCIAKLSLRKAGSLRQVAHHAPEDCMLRCAGHCPCQGRTHHEGRAAVVRPNLACIGPHSVA